MKSFLLIAISILLNSCSSLTGTFIREKVIVDMDIPNIHDDGVAFALLEKSKKVSIEALTISADEKGSVQARKNIADVKSSLRREDYTIANDSVVAMVEAIKEYPGEIVIVTMGPLTNVAKIITDHPELVGSIKEIIMYGGALFTQGKINNVAEYNFWKDPRAANLVLSSPIPKTLFGFDVGRKVDLDNELFEEISNYKSNFAMFFSRELGRGMDGFFNQKKSLHLNSSLLAVHLITKRLITNVKKFQLRVDDSTGKNRGKLEISGKGFFTDVVLGIDEEKLYRTYFELITKHEDVI